MIKPKPMTPQQEKEFADYLLECFSSGVKWVPGPFRDPPVDYKPIGRPPSMPDGTGEELVDTAVACRILGDILSSYHGYLGISNQILKAIEKKH